MGKIYAGQGDLAKEIKKIYAGVGGVAKEVSKVYAGVNGSAVLIWQNLVSIPVMTSNTTPYGEAIKGGACAATSSTYPYQALDKNPATYFEFKNTLSTTKAAYLIYDFGFSIIPVKIYVKLYKSSGSSNLILSGGTTSSASTTNFYKGSFRAEGTIDVETDSAYRYFRIYYDVSSGVTFRIFEFNVWGYRSG